MYQTHVRSCQEVESQRLELNLSFSAGSGAKVCSGRRPRVAQPGGSRRRALPTLPSRRESSCVSETTGKGMEETAGRGGVHLALTVPGKPKKWPLRAEWSWREEKKGTFCEQRPGGQPGKQNAPRPVSQNTIIYHGLAKLYLHVLIFLQWCVSLNVHFHWSALQGGETLETGQDWAQSPVRLWLLRDAEMVLNGKPKHPSV